MPTTKRYHISKAGKVAACSAASAESCPLQGKHFPSKDTAQFYLENQELAERQFTPRDKLEVKGFTATRLYARSIKPGNIVQFDDYGDLTVPVEVLNIQKRENNVKLLTRPVHGGEDAPSWTHYMQPNAWLVLLTRNEKPKVALTQAHSAALTDAVTEAEDEWTRLGRDTSKLRAAAKGLEDNKLTPANIATLKEASEIALDEWDLERQGEQIADLQDAIALLHRP